MLGLSGDIWQRWDALHRDLEATSSWKLAGVFRGHEGDNFRKATRKILYTGKATAGPYRPRPEELGHFGCNRKAFWSFGRRLNGLTGGSPDGLENIAWSNLCKIGTANGNPNNKLVRLQATIAIETLRQEWAELEPTLVVCVAEGYQEELIYRALKVRQDHGDGFEAVSVDQWTFWRRPAIDGMPAFLWMKHPERKRQEYKNAAATLAQELLATPGTHHAKLVV